MTTFRIGDQVVFNARTYEVLGVTPVSVSPPMVHLVDAEKGECLEVAIEDLERRGGDCPARRG
jgi:hypothetical protein